MTAARLLLAGALAGALAAGPVPGVAASAAPATEGVAAPASPAPGGSRAEPAAPEGEPAVDTPGAVHPGTGPDASAADPYDPLPLGVLGYVEREPEGATTPASGAAPDAGAAAATPGPDAAGPPAPAAVRTARLEPSKAPNAARDDRPYAADRIPGAADGLAAAERPDRLVVLKRPHLLLLFRGQRLLRYYDVALGSDPRGPKTSRGDGRTPEGLYRIAGRNPHSHFHRALRISYPNARDLARAAEAGTTPGGSIMIHGLPNGLGTIGPDHTTADWTDGCIAVTNEEIDELWELVDDGTPIQILP